MNEERTREEGHELIFSLGGVVASVILIAVGIGAIVIGASDRSEVGDTLSQ